MEKRLDLNKVYLLLKTERSSKNVWRNGTISFTVWPRNLKKATI